MTVKGVANHFELHTSNGDVTIPWYKDLLGYFEWKVVAEFPAGIGFSDGNVSMWFFRTHESHRGQAMNRDAAGLGHFGIHVDSKEDVDTFIREFMQPKGIIAEFGTPKAREDFGGKYYQVMFVDPEGLAIEVFTA